MIETNDLAIHMAIHQEYAQDTKILANSAVSQNEKMNADPMLPAEAFAQW